MVIESQMSRLRRLRWKTRKQIVLLCLVISLH